ncbi:hypothetical protein [Streptomyces sp. SP2-10]|uniref:hypothetical protein n=1 Tax=Streptomyces sp. SP2-10 TaxID=2873385 RepID=UPI001CA6BB38|nr:hypothetical protein [Streptomyces sp. SP2-10]MBY8839957.1 hypothetical protein [Streptomyces sp. SP2-10]
MADRLPAHMREFASYLDGLLARLDQGAGWCGVFWQRDPEGMQACLDGREVPPWDVVEALLEDLGGMYGRATATAERERARALHAAALDAHDARPGAREDLADRLDVMLREQRYAAERHAGLARLLSAPAPGTDTDSLRTDLAWARDDHRRATARCDELRARIDELDRTAAPSSPGRDTAPAPARIPARAVPPAPAPADTPAAPRRRRRGSARFAGLDADQGAAPATAPQAPAPLAPDAAVRRTPRGARFAGAAEPAEAAAGTVQAVDEAAAAEVAGAVGRLARLRTEGRSGEAHALLVELVGWPAGRLPPLADALHRAGLGADWATLLWESAALPAERLVAAADALAAAGRDTDAQRMLWQGVARPAEQIGAAVLRLDEEGRHREARALLDACVRARPPQDAARCAAAGPRHLVPLLLEAARGVSEERHWDLVHALRVAGHAP